MFVKVCGITRVQDAELAAELGATAVGFIFWPESPRYVDPAHAQHIVRRVSSNVTTIGVFVNESIEQIRRIMESVSLDAAQLHGAESPTFCQQLGQMLATPKPEGRSGLAAPKPEGRRRVIKAIGVKNAGAPDLQAFGEDVLILLDAHDSVRHGGTGRTVDWDIARTIAASRPTILSGGLNAGNVGTAIEMVHPYGVDVSSGVESGPGVKDAARLKSFFEALNG